MPASAAPTPPTRGGLPSVRARVKTRLAFDHAEILEAAVQRLRSKVEYTSLPAYLMPPEFTLPELQRVYEIVLDRPLEKSAFRTRMLSADLVEPVAKMRKGPNRPAQLYRLKKARSPVFFRADVQSAGLRRFGAPQAPGGYLHAANAGLMAAK